MYFVNAIVVLLSMAVPAIAESNGLRTRELTVCDTLKACYLVNIKTRAEFLLTGNNSYTLDPNNDRGYSIRCVVDGTPGAESDFIKFYYEQNVQDEFGLPRYMNGDSNEGAWINPVPYLETCGRKRIFIAGHVWAKVCFTKEYFINIEKSDGSCGLPTPVPSPVKPPTDSPVADPTRAPVRPPTKAPTRAPVKPPTKAPTRTPTKPPTKAPTRAPVKPPTKAPTSAPVKPPTKAPTRSPTKPPTRAPTRAPVKPPTKAPTSAPVTKAPTRAPVKPPTKAPTRAPTKPTTKAPTRAPIKPPTKAPTRAPVKPPTKAPTKAPSQGSTCVFRPEVFNFSVISFGDAIIAAHSMYKGVNIGGNLVDGSPNEHGTVDRTMSYIKSLDSNARFNFNGGLTLGRSVDSALIQHFEYLATHAVSSTSGDFKVYVLTRGGTYNLYDFVPGGQGEDNGKTLVIFNTSEAVTLTRTYDSRQFGPSVIAPFSKVTILGDAGYVDGLVVGKTVVTSGSNQSQLQLHGDTYTGPIRCV